jgi:hypothetical protein
VCTVFVVIGVPWGTPDADEGWMDAVDGPPVAGDSVPVPLPTPEGGVEGKSVVEPRLEFVPVEAPLIEPEPAVELSHPAAARAAAASTLINRSFTGASMTGAGGAGKRRH